MITFKSSLLNASNSNASSEISPMLAMVEPEVEPMLIIDANLRTIDIPRELYDIGVSGDHYCEEIFFKITRYFDDEDLSSHTCKIRVINAGNEYSESNVDIVDVNDNYIIFGWKINNYVTRYNGIINFTVQFETVNNSIIQYQWQTKPAQLNIMAGLNIEKTITDKDDVLFRTLSNQIQELQKEIDRLKMQTEPIDTMISQIGELSSDVKYLQDNVVYALDE